MMLVVVVVVVVGVVVLVGRVVVIIVEAWSLCACRRVSMGGKRGWVHASR